MTERVVDRDPAPEPSLEYSLEYLFTRETRVRREVIGLVGEGFRVNVITEGGEVRGPALAGTCGFGADWFTLRRDGVGTVDSRITIHSADGAVLHSYYTGVADFGEDALERIERGEVPEPGLIHVAARFQTSASRYTWMNRIQAVGIGRSRPTGNLWETYALR